MRRDWLLVALCVACGDDDGPVSASDASVGFACASALDAATALGVRGVDLWDTFVGVHTLVASGISVQGGVRKLDPVTFTITLSPGTQQLPGLEECSVVTVPVQVLVQSVTPPINETAFGLLGGSPLNAYITFATSEVLQNQQPRLYGQLHLEEGQEPELSLQSDSTTRWTAPPQVTP